jgi:hypothetical protein
MNSLPESLVRFRAELEDAIRRELEAQAHADSNGRGAHVLRAVRGRPGRTTLAFAVLAVAVGVALFVSTPWQTSPGFLERAQAALTPPAGRILHMKWELVFTSADAACRTTNIHEVWIDLTAPHSYRAFVPPAGAMPEAPGTAPPSLPGTGGLPCPAEGTPVEVGGTADGTDPLRFVPPNTLAPARRIYFQPVADPWARVRELIAEGRARREGTVLRDRQTVERVRFDPPTSCPPPAAGHCPTEPEYGYFDPETLYPVAWEYARDPMFPLVRNRERYLAYEYLPRTTENLALTDIRAQHPDATGP